MRTSASIGFAAAILLALPAGAEVIRAQDYIAVATAELDRALERGEGRIEVQPLGHHADLEVSSAADLRLRARAPASVPTYRMVVWVDLLREARIVRRVPVHFNVRWLKPALVARRRLHAGAALVPEMFEQRICDVAAVKGAVVTSFGELEGQRLRCVLEQDAVLPLAAVEARPPVEAGEQITVVSS